MSKTVTSIAGVEVAVASYDPLHGCYTGTVPSNFGLLVEASWSPDGTCFDRGEAFDVAPEYLADVCDDQGPGTVG